MSDLVLHLKGNLGIHPEVVGYLASIREGEYYYSYYRLRHPGGIFNIAWSYVIDDFLELLRELEEFQDKYGEYNDYKQTTTLRLKLRILINDFFKFRDSLYDVIQACCKKHTRPSEKEFTRTWLTKNNYHAGKELHSKINRDLEYFNSINNKLKHTSSTIETIYFYNKSSAIFGFYVTGVSDDSGIGPDEAIHPKIDGEYSACSYNFSLKRIPSQTAAAHPRSRAAGHARRRRIIMETG